MRRGVARRRRDPGQPDRDRAHDRRTSRRADLRARPRVRRRRRRAARRTRCPIGAPPDAEKVVEAWLPFGKMFDIVWSGKRHVMMGATQIDRFGNQNIACIGPWAKPKAQLLGVRGAPGQHGQPPHELLGAGARPTRVRRAGRLRVRRRLRPRGRGRARPRRSTTRSGASSRTSACSTSRRPITRCASARSIPGVTVDDVQELTAFPLVVPDDVPESRLPTDEELRLIREVLDPAQRSRCRGPRAMKKADASGAAHPVLRPRRRPVSDRADRHGLGRRRAPRVGDGERRRPRHPRRRAR